MTNDAETEPDIDDHKKWTLWAFAAAALLLALFGVIAIGTVRGCFNSNTQQAAESLEKKKKEEEEKREKAPFKIDPPVVLPSEPKVVNPPTKPGHWATASQEMRANYRDFVGDSRLSVVDSQGRSYPITGTPFEVRSSRPVLLTKGRPKSTQTTFFTPAAPAGKTISISMELEERGLGGAPPQARTSLALMPSYQYHFVVLAKTPARYSYVKTIDSVRVPFNGETEMDSTEDTYHYVVVELGADQLDLLPENPLTWTSIAYVLWDQVDPGDPFPADQKKALVDWLHWGGQLIISGPDSLDVLKGSFLDPLLPATSAGTRKFEAGDKDLAEFSDGWMISTALAAGKPLQPTKPWSGIKLDVRKSPDVKVLPNTGGLFVERQVGRGRIVVSAIRLSERDFINWRSGFESFFNAGLLRRPPRRYYPGVFGRATVNWAEAEKREHRLDASINTNLFYFSRDLGTDVAYHYQDLDDPQQLNFQTQLNQIPRNRRGQFNQPQTPQTARQYVAPSNAGGIGAWNDFSLTANAARSSLIEAAGVEVPDSGFVVLCLAAYLVALVPINWLIFYTIGRVEWAWIAAPIIAIAGTWVIVQRARLDIGFVRAQTEIGILEQQPDYPRAHMSRYTALYTSLSTTYDFDFANMSTLIAPFPLEPFSTTAASQGISPIDFQRYDHVRLTGLPISSNTTGYVHSEQMLPLDGPIRLGQSSAARSPQIENRSTMELHSACVVKRNEKSVQGRWIGNLLPGQSVPLAMPTISGEKIFAKERNDDAKTFKDTQLNLEPMFRLALDLNNMAIGETRLVGRVDEVLSGEDITPAASQIRGATLVVAHLQYAPPPPPKKDVNTKQDVKETDNAGDTAPVEL